MCFKACLMNNLLLIGSIQEGNLNLLVFDIRAKDLIDRVECFIG